MFYFFIFLCFGVQVFFLRSSSALQARVSAPMRPLGRTPAGRLNQARVSAPMRPLGRTPAGWLNQARVSAPMRPLGRVIANFNELARSAGLVAWSTLCPLFRWLRDFFLRILCLLFRSFCFF